MLEFTRLKRNLKKDVSAFKKIKIAILSDSSSQLLHLALKGIGVDNKYNFEIFESDYDQIDRQVFDKSSELYAFSPEFIIISKSPYKLLSKFSDISIKEKIDFTSELTNYYESLIWNLEANELYSKVILLNFPDINDGVFGNYSNKIDFSFTYQIRRLNMELMRIATLKGDVFICDVQQLQSYWGARYCFDNKFYITSDSIWSIDFLPVLASNLSLIISAALGGAKKCLILDLDNTVWGGIIGDDGMEGIKIGDLGIGKAFSNLQKWAKSLKERGIILCICSKNTEAIAMEPFENHPDMILRLADISVFVANWDNKVDNIRHIQSILNIGFDSMVFIDDNPFERNMVRMAIPDIVIPELPEDPVEYVSFLSNMNLFETASFSEEDIVRTAQYQNEVKRKVFQKSFSNEDEYLGSLKMLSLVKSIDEFSIPRVAQLSQRSNQFNLRTIRYNEEDIKRIVNNLNFIHLAFELTDTFGENGLICLVILEKRMENLFIDSWIMSCRVLNRGMESFVLNKVCEIAKKNKIKNIIGEYLPTKKNGIVKDHYQKLGFEHKEEKWVLEVDTYNERKTFINEKL